MRIEDEIKAEEFYSEQHKLSTNLIYTHYWAYDRLQEIFEEFELTPQQHNVLRILRSAFPLSFTTSQILDRMMEKNAGVSRIVDRLVKKELVLKEVSKEDKRLVDITISYKGHALCEKIDEERKRLDGIYGNLTTKEAAELNRLLDKMRG
ncbi:MAG: MarR family transcriptional regulator [Cyclobacteriaceae bacterium]